jgi:hypothetical protein
MRVMLRTKIEQFSSLNVIGPPQHSSHNYSRLHRLITPAQIAEGKKLVEPTEVSVHLNDLKAVGVVGVVIGVVGVGVGIGVIVLGIIIVGVVVVYHKYSRID